MNSDATIWENIRLGDKQAFDETYQLHVRSLYDYLFRMCKDEFLTQDVIHDLFVRIWEKRATLGMTDNIRFYLMRTSRRMLVERLQKDAKLGQRVGLVDEQDFDVEFSHEVKLINDQITKENQQQLAEALQALSKRQREIIYHKYFSNLKHSQIAEMMELSTQGVYNLMSKALKSLSQMIKKEKT